MNLFHDRIKDGSRQVEEVPFGKCLCITEPHGFCYGEDHVHGSFGRLSWSFFKLPSSPLNFGQYHFFPVEWKQRRKVGKMELERTNKDLSGLESNVGRRV